MGFLKSYCIHQLKESQLLCSYAVLDKIYQGKFSVFCLFISHLEVMFHYCLDDSAEVASYGTHLKMTEQKKNPLFNSLNKTVVSLLLLGLSSFYSGYCSVYAPIYKGWN